MIRKLPHWIKQGKVEQATDMRYLMHDYVLILANTGMRHGAEVLNLNGKHITLFEENDLQYLEMSVTGKRAGRISSAAAEPSIASNASMNAQKTSIT